LVLAPVLYRFIERFMLVVALFTLIGLVAACAHPSVWAHLPRSLSAVVRPEWPPPRPWSPSDAPTLLTGITFAGLGGFWTLFYSYWLREKGVAMARHAGRVTGVLGRAEAIARTGNAPAETSDAAPTLRRWLRYLLVDSGIGIFGNIFTTLMTCLLAFALLTPQGILPQGWEIATVQSRFFSLRWGPVGEALFYLVAAAFLADTWLSTVDAVSRANTDIVQNFFPRARRRSPRWWYFCFLFLLTAVTCATMPLAQPGPLILLTAVTGFAGTVVFSVGVLILNHRVLPPLLPRFARPGRIGAVLLSITCLAYFALAAAYLCETFR
jgi:hypothetical protein